MNQSRIQDRIEDAMADEDNINAGAIPVPPTCDPNHTYQLLWKGRKLGGMLYLTMDTEDITKLYFVLRVQGLEEHFVGTVSISPEVTGYENLCGIVLAHIEKCYIANEDFLYKAALRANEIRIH